MIAVAAWLSVGFGLSVIVVRRRSVAIGLMAMQSLVVSVVALSASRPAGRWSSSQRPLCWSRRAHPRRAPRRSGVEDPEAARVRAGSEPLLRLAITVAVVLIANVLLPPMPTLNQVVQQASVSLVCIGVAVDIAAGDNPPARRHPCRRERPGLRGDFLIAGGMPAVIELGALFDLTLVLSVAIVFHHRIYALLGSGNSALLNDLRD